MEFPERFAIRLGIIIAALVFLLGAFLNSGTNNQGSEWLRASAEIWWHLCKLTVFPLWIIMRVWTLIGGVTAGRRS